MKIVHNNDITQKSFLLHHSTRKLTPELTETALGMLGVGARPSAVALDMSKKSGKIILAKDLFNLKTRTKHISGGIQCFRKIQSG